MGKSSIDDNIHIVCLQEGKTYTLEVLDDEIQAQLRLLKGGAEIIEEIGEGYEDGFIGFVRRLKESLQAGNLTSGDEGETNDDLEWVRGKSFNVRYIGLYAYSDSKGNELILYFAPKFVHARRGMDEDSVKERREQLLDRYDRVLLAIDRYQKDQARLDTSWIEKSDSCVGLLPLVVMLVRDYLEYGLYTVHPKEQAGDEQKHHNHHDADQRAEKIADFFLKQCVHSKNNGYSMIMSNGKRAWMPVFFCRLSKPCR